MLPAAGGRVQTMLIYTDKSAPASRGKEVKGNLKLLRT